MEIDRFAGCCTSRVLNTFPTDRTMSLRTLRTHVKKLLVAGGGLHYSAATGPNQQTAHEALLAEGFRDVGSYAGHAGKITISVWGLEEGLPTSSKTRPRRKRQG